MNAALDRRFAAAVAAMAITVSLFSAIVAIADRPISGALLAQADTARVH